MTREEKIQRILEIPTEVARKAIIRKVTIDGPCESVDYELDKEWAEKFWDVLDILDMKVPRVPVDPLTESEIRSAAGVYEVPARVWTDDRRVEVEFDARDYLLTAKDEKVRDLDYSNWGHGYDADAVAEYAAGTQPQVKEVFRYLRLINSSALLETVGFEVEVDQAAAAKFLKQHRPILYESLEVCRLPEDT